VDPHCYDAHVATGVSKYIIGTMAAPVRWLLRLGGVAGDKQAGIAELQITAERGHYLAPFARILLAIAYVREKDKAKALDLLASLRSEFPDNPLFAREIARLDTVH
jgi:predicted Zn-dependent protease